MSSAKHIHSPQANYHVPGVFLDRELALTRKARNITSGRIKTHCHTCVEAACNHLSTQQSRQATLVPFASLSAISGTFNSLFKVLFTFPSWYLFAICLEPMTNGTLTLVDALLQEAYIWRYIPKLRFKAGGPRFSP